MTVDLSKLDTAIDCFKKSRKLRDVGGRDPGHDRMFLNLDVCVTELEACKNARRISSSGVAATRGAGTICTQDTCLNTRTHSTDEGGTAAETHASSTGAPAGRPSILVTVVGLAVVVAAVTSFSVCVLSVLFKVSEPSSIPYRTPSVS